MAGLITSSIVTYEVKVSEEAIKSALITEALEKHGLLHEGKAIPGVEAQVLRGDGRGKNGGGYVVRLHRDLTKSGQAAIPAPAKAILP